MAKTTVPSQYIADNAITTAKIAANAVTAAQIAGGAIVSVDLGDNSITIASIAGNAVGSSEIAKNAVGSSHIAKNSVDSSELVSGSIDTVHLSADAVNGTKIADDSIDSEHYVDGSIDTAHIADSQVTNAKLANSSVTVNSNSLSLGGTLTLDTDDIGEGVTNQYFTNARAQSAISAGTGITVSSGEISIAGNAITATMIAANAVGSSEIAANSVDSAEIAANAVSTSELASTAAPTFASITTTGNGDIGGNLTVTGNLQVDGTTTTINSTNLSVDDKLITVAAGAANAAAADGAGIEVDITGATNPSITYDGTNDEWDFNKGININGGAGAYNFAATNSITIDNSSGYGAMELGGTSGAYIDLKNPSSDDYDLRLITFGSGGQIIAATGSPLLLASSGNSNQLYLDSSGNVGIGVSPTGAKLQVQGDGIGIKLDGTANTTRTIFFRNTTSSNPAQIYSDGSLRIRTEDASTNITFHTNSTGTNNERMRIDSTGNVIIGSTFTRTSGAGGTSTGNLSLEGTGAGSAIDLVNTTTTTGRAMRIVSLNSGGLAIEDLDDSGAQVLKIDSNGNTILGDASNSATRQGYLSVMSAATISSGFNDIGEFLAPSQAGGGVSLNVGVANSTRNLAKLVFNYSGTSGSTNNSLGLGFYAADNLLVVKANGNVGIGTIDPKQKLTVAGRFNSDGNDDYYGAWLTGDSSTGGDSHVAVGAWYSSAAYLERREGENHTHLYEYNPAHHIVIQAGSGADGRASTSSGNVGIGVRGPSDKLHIKTPSGDTAIRLENSAGNNSRFILDSSNNTKIEFNATPRITIDSNGYVGIGQAPSGSHRLEVSGDISASGQAVFREVEIQRNSDYAGIWFNGNISNRDTNHVLWNDYYGGPGARSGAGTGVDGIIWNTYDKFLIQAGTAGAQKVIESYRAAGSPGSGTYGFRAYYNNAEQIATTSAGVNITGDLNINDIVTLPILQVAQYAVGGSTTTNSTTYVDVGNSISFTPKSSSSKLLIMHGVQTWYGSTSSGDGDMYFRFLINGTARFTNSRALGNFDGGNNARQHRYLTHYFTYDNTTTSALTIKTQARMSGSTGVPGGLNFYHVTGATEGAESNMYIIVEFGT